MPCKDITQQDIAVIYQSSKSRGQKEMADLSKKTETVRWPGFETKFPEGKQIFCTALGTV